MPNGLKVARNNRAGQIVRGDEAAPWGIKSSSSGNLQSSFLDDATGHEKR